MNYFFINVIISVLSVLIVYLLIYTYYLKGIFEKLEERLIKFKKDVYNELYENEDIRTLSISPLEYTEKKQSIGVLKNKTREQSLEIDLLRKKITKLEEYLKIYYTKEESTFEGYKDKNLYITKSKAK